MIFWANYSDLSRRLVTPNGGLVRESPQNDLNSGLGIIIFCPEHPILQNSNSSSIPHFKSSPEIFLIGKLWTKKVYIHFFSKLNSTSQNTKPRCSMYGMFTYISPKFMVNVGKSSIHGSHGKRCGPSWNIFFHVFSLKLTNRSCKIGVHHKNLVTWENRAPKNWQVALVPWWCFGFLQVFRVVSGDEKANLENGKLEDAPFLLGFGLFFRGELALP